jgi:hypothetical protein
LYVECDFQSTVTPPKNRFIRNPFKTAKKKPNKKNINVSEDFIFLSKSPSFVQILSSCHQPGSGGCQGTSTSQLVGSVVLGCPAARAVPPVRYLDFFISNRVPAPAGPWASASAAEAHAGIAFAKRFFGYNKRQKVRIR